MADPTPVSGPTDERLAELLREAMQEFEQACFWAKKVASGDIMASGQSRAWKRGACRLLSQAKSRARVVAAKARRLA